MIIPDFTQTSRPINTTSLIAGNSSVCPKKHVGRVMRLWTTDDVGIGRNDAQANRVDLLGFRAAFPAASDRSTP